MVTRLSVYRDTHVSHKPFPIREGGTRGIEPCTYVSDRGAQLACPSTYTRQRHPGSMSIHTGQRHPVSMSTHIGHP